MRSRNIHAKAAGGPQAGGKMFGLHTPSHTGLTRLGFQHNICLLLTDASNVLGRTLLLCKKLQESSQKRRNLWKREAWLMWRLWGKHPKPERETVKPCGGCGVCQEALRTQPDSPWRRVRKQTAKAGTGQPAAGKSEEKHCHRALAGQGLPFFPKTKETLCVCRYVTPQHLISPHKRACKQALCERGGNRC